MGGTHFYLTLPSNASLNEFPNNKTTSYRVKLPQSIDLEGVWEVGLNSISYPNTWYTLQKGVDTHFFYGDRTGLFQQAIMDYGYYQSMPELIKAANKAVSRNVSDNIKLTYNALTGEVTVQIKNGFQFAVMKPLSIILGFGGKDVMLKETTESPYVADLTTAYQPFTCTATLCNPKSLEIRVLSYSKAFLPREHLVTSLLKRSQTFSMYLSKENYSRTWKFF